jgi:excisionase family DNA binding protein
MEEGYITVNDAAARLGVTARTVRLWLTAGRLAGERVQGRFGPEWRVCAGDLERLMESRPERALVTDPRVTAGATEVRSSLALLAQENARLREGLQEAVQHLRSLSAHVEALSASIEVRNEDLEAVRADNREVLRRVAEGFQLRQREGQEIQSTLRGMAAQLRQEQELVEGLRDKLEQAMRPRASWWQRVWRRQGKEERGIR